MNIVGGFVALCALFLRRSQAGRRAAMSSPPMTPEEQLRKMKAREEKQRKMQTEPSNKDREVSKQFAMNFQLACRILV